MTKRPNRSDKYQYLLVETTVSEDFLSSFSNDQSMDGILNPFKYSEDLLDLKDKLKARFWVIFEQNMTKRQLIVSKLFCDGYTQTEIAKKLNVNQSSITKSLNGNVDYKNGKQIYGGVIKKMKKLVAQDLEIQEILSKIDELTEGKY